MMLHVVMLGVIITAVLLAGLPEDLKLALAHTVSDPIKTHVHRFGPFLFHIIISDTHGGTVVGDHRGWGCGCLSSSSVIRSGTASFRLRKRPANSALAALESGFCTIC
jgi:hypothetical protein